ncbi:MAG: hypothetical protein N2D54_08640 [Chloroflexota bacterium]
MAGLLTLVIVAISFFGAKGIAAVYFPNAEPPLDITVEGTPEQNARGEYLADIGCILYQGTYKGDIFVTNPEFPLAGGVNIAEAEEEFIEMMRSGVRPGNDPFPAEMPFQNAAKMTDADLKALFAYLTTDP